MGQRILVDVSPTGVQHSVDIDDRGFTAIEHTPTSVENQILDECARLQSLAQARGRAFQHAAKIPINTYAAWKREWREKYSDVWTWPTFEVMKLNSRDNCRLRTGHKRGAFGKLL